MSGRAGRWTSGSWPSWRRFVAKLPGSVVAALMHCSSQLERRESGHTWHHSENILFGIAKHGLVPPYAPKDYESDMPTFGAKLSDEEIWSVLA